MRGKTHSAFGIALALILIRLNALPPIGINPGHGFLTFVFIGTLLPDLDHNDSTIGKRFPIISWLTEKILGHRGLYHSFFGLFFTTLLFYLFFKTLSIGSWRMLTFAVGLGFVSHLMTDSMTIHGVKWLPPFKEFHIKGPIRTGSTIESIIFISLILIIGALLSDFGFSILGVI